MAISKIVGMVAVIVTQLSQPQPQPQPQPQQLQVETTAYCSCRVCNGEYANGITASGKTARASHTIAVDPSVVPLGTVVEIDGVRYVAEDVGGAIKGNKIDIYMESHEKALNYGRQTKTATIYK